MKKIRSQKRDKSMPFSVSIGVGVAVLISVVFLCVVTSLVSNESLLLNTAILVMPVVQLLSAFAGCLVAGQTVSNNKSAACGIVCACYYALLAGVSALFMQGISGGFWVGILMSVLGCFAAMFLCAREKSSAGKGKRKRAHG